MANIHDDPAALKALQDDIYRERILRARKMTVEQRLSDVFELSNHQFGMMLGGAMHHSVPGMRPRAGRRSSLGWRVWTRCVNTASTSPRNPLAHDSRGPSDQ